MSQRKTISTEQLCRITNRTKDALHKIAQQGKIPKPTDGQWPAAETIRALFAYWQLMASGGSVKEEKAKADLAEQKAKAALAEMKRKEKAGDLIPKAQVETIHNAAFVPIRDRFLALAAETAHKANPSDPEHAFAVLQEWSDQAMEIVRQALHGTP